MSLAEMIAQREALDAQIAEEAAKAKAEALAAIGVMIADGIVTREDIAGALGLKPAGAATRKCSASTLAPKYKNNATGETWSGRGLQPKWLKAALSAGAKLGEFAIPTTTH